MTAKEAAQLVEKIFPKAEAESVYIYKDKYLVIAFDSSLGLNNHSDPYYIVDSEDGSVKNFSPIMDFEGFDIAIEGEDLLKQ